MEKKIEKWLECGYIDKAVAVVLLNDVKQDKERTRKLRINITLYTIAVIFLGIGVITFISSNDWLLKLLNSNDLLKILLMSVFVFGSLWGGYFIAYENKKFPKLGNALIILSSLLVGGLYALLGQTYNINANNSSLMFVWLFSILPLAYLFKSNVINIISVILFIFGVTFYYEELALDTYKVWTVFIPVVTGLALYTAGNIPAVLEKFNKFSLTYKTVGAVPVFITFLILTCSVESSYHMVSTQYMLPIIFLMLANLVICLSNKNPGILLKLETLFMISTPALLMLMLCASDVNTVCVMLTANLILILMIAFGYGCGYKFENGKIVGLTNCFLLIYAMTNYCRWGWSLLDKAVFFILGGIVLLAAGLFLEKGRKKIISKEKS